MKKSFYFFKITIALLFIILTFSSSFALTYYSKMDGLWSDSNSWVTDKCGGSVNAGTYPKSGDEVIICDGITITVEGNLSCKKLTVGTGSSGVISYSNASTTFLYVLSDIELKPGARIEYKGNTGQKHFLAVEGDIKNEGLIDFRVDTDDYVIIEFLGNTDSKIVSSSGSWVLSTINLKKGIKSAVVSIENDGFSKALTDGSMAINYTSVSLTKGILRHNASGELGNIYEPGKTVSDPMTIPADVSLEGFKGSIKIPINNTVYLEGSIRLFGGLVGVSTGLIGNTSTNYGLFYRKGTGEIMITGGSLFVAGAFKNEGADASLVFTISGGQMSVGAVRPTVETFKINTGSVFVMTDGQISLENSSFFTDASVIKEIDFDVDAKFYKVIGGKLVFGGGLFTSKVQDFRFATCIDLPHVVVGGTITSPVVVRPYKAICNEINLLSLAIRSNGFFDVRDFKTSNDHLKLNITSSEGGLALSNDGYFVPRSGWVTFSGNNQVIGGINEIKFSSLKVSPDPSTNLWNGPIVNTNISVKDTVILFRNINLNGNDLTVGESDKNPGYMSVIKNVGVYKGTLSRYFNSDRGPLTLKKDDFLKTNDLTFYITSKNDKFKTSYALKNLYFPFDANYADRTVHIGKSSGSIKGGFISVKFNETRIDDGRVIDGSYTNVDFYDNDNHISTLSGFNWEVKVLDTDGLKGATYSIGFINRGIAVFEIKYGGKPFDTYVSYQKNIDAFRAVLKDKAVGISGNRGSYGDEHYVRDFCYRDDKYKPSGPGFVADFNLIRNNVSVDDLTNIFYMGGKDEASCFFKICTGGGFTPIVPCNPPFYPILDYMKPASLVAEKEAESYNDVKMLVASEKNVTVFPNPVDKDIITISWNSLKSKKKEGTVLVQLINLQGKSVIEKSISYSSAQESVQLDLINSAIKNGVYTLVVFDENQSWQQHIVINR